MLKPLDTYNISQRFFVEKILDLFYENNLDSYRVRYNNANTCLRELYQLIKAWRNNKIKRFETISNVVDELIDLLSQDQMLIFDIITKDSFKTELSSLSKQKEGKIDEDLIDYLEYIISHIITQNNNCIENSFSIIDNLLNFDKNELKYCIPHFITLSQEIESLATELLNIGYSKSFLYRLIARTFRYQNKGRIFQERWDFFKRVIKEKKIFDYAVIFKFNAIKTDDFLDHFERKVSNEYLPDSRPLDEVSEFIEENLNIIFKEYTVQACDFYQAIRIAKEKLAHFLDTLHFSYNNVSLNLDSNVLVIDQSNKKKARVQNISYKIDGDTHSNPNANFEYLNSLINNINENNNISINVKDKIKSAVRYLRMGNESIELEQKYICYWIALEHIFSIHIREISTFKRMRENFTNMQINYYLKRNIQYLHNMIKDNIHGFQNKDLIEKISNNELIYFANDAYLDELIVFFLNSNPLIAFKINRMKSILRKTEDVKKYIDNHKENVSRHLVRLYRVRNELMHDAAIIHNIENLTGNLKYYLVFTLNLILKHFSTINLNSNDMFELEDFFNKQKMILNYIVLKYNKDEMLNVEFVDNILI